MSLTLAFALVFSLAAPPRRDAWLGRDKVKHFVAAAAIQSVAYAAWRGSGATRPAGLWRASAVTAAASLGKELLDRKRGRIFSVRDLAWDAGGAGAATVAIIYTTRN